MRKTAILFIILLYCLVFVCGCLQASSEPPVYATMTTIKPFARSVGIPNTYQKYVNNEDHFYVYLPPGWSTKVADKSESSVVSDQKDVLQKIVFFNDKDTDPSDYGMYVLGMDTKISAMVSSGDSKKDLIGFNDGVINGIKNSAEKGGATNFVIESKGDYSYYGNHEAVTNILSYSNGEVKIKSKITVIKRGSIYYTIFYYAIDDVYAQQIGTIDIILPTFTPTD